MSFSLTAFMGGSVKKIWRFVNIRDEDRRKVYCKILQI